MFFLIDSCDLFNKIKENDYKHQFSITDINIFEALKGKNSKERCNSFIELDYFVKRSRSTYNLSVEHEYYSKILNNFDYQYRNVLIKYYFACVIAKFKGVELLKCFIDCLTIVINIVYFIKCGYENGNEEDTIYVVDGISKSGYYINKILNTYIKNIRDDYAEELFDFLFDKKKNEWDEMIVSTYNVIVSYFNKKTYTNVKLNLIKSKYLCYETLFLTNDLDLRKYNLIEKFSSLLLKCKDKESYDFYTKIIALMFSKNSHFSFNDFADFYFDYISKKTKLEFINEGDKKHIKKKCEI